MSKSTEAFMRFEMALRRFSPKSRAPHRGRLSPGVVTNRSRLVSGGRSGRKRPRNSPRQPWLKSRALVIEPLETRALLNASLPAVWHAPLDYYITFTHSDTPFGLTPNQIRGAYGLGTYTNGVLSSGISFSRIQGDGRGQTIAIVDAYDDPTALNDLNFFSTTFGLPTFGGAGNPTFQKLNQNGGTSLPGTDPDGPSITTGKPGTWESEESMDIEWAHATAPLANIILFEADNVVNNDLTNLYAAVKTAASTPGVVAVSMSWSVAEVSSDSTHDSDFTTPSGHIGGSATLGGTGLAGGVTFLAASGDSGAYGSSTATATTITPQYPACSPNVVAVGGTVLTVSGSDPNYTYGGETSWGNGANSGSIGFNGGGGGGISAYESQPAYQTGVVNAFSTTQRTYPDVSCDADPNMGVPVYDSWDCGTEDPWLATTPPATFGNPTPEPVGIGGTSLATPLWAGIIAVADEGRAIAGRGSLDGPSETLTALYGLPTSDFHDITTGASIGPTSGSPSYSPASGYDLATGLGGPVDNLLIPALAAYSAAPSVTGLSPATGRAGGGTLVTITGTGFTGATAVKFGTSAATNVTVVSATKITADSPAGTGTVDVTVTTLGGTSVANPPADQFSYVAAPSVTGLSPATGPVAGGTLVTITGTGFTGATAVKFGTSAATNVTVVSATKITADSPAGTGTVDVTVTTLGGTSVANPPADQFSYVAAPSVTGLSPATGPVAGGTLVTITGTGFTGATAVKFGTSAATNVTVVSATKITADSPAGTGTVDVTVTTLGGTSVANPPADQFSYVAAPSVTGLSPATGLAAGGTLVTITGAGFSGTTAVKFGATAATSFSVVSDTKITATSPAGSGVVDVTITTAGGTSVASAADKFTYLSVPAVTGFDSSSEPIAGGMQVTITGSRFTGATAVKFGTTAATSFSLISDTQITVTVPAGADGTADVTVVTPGGTSRIVPEDQFTYYMPGCTALGLYDPTQSVFYPRNSNTAGYANNFIVYGTPNGYIPIAGDWNGDGTQTIGLYDRATGLFYLSNSNASQMADTVFVFGPAHSQDIPIVGNWNGKNSGAQTVGLYDPATSTFYLRNSNSTGFADVTFAYRTANANLIPLAGHWYGGSTDTIGLYDPTTSTFSLRNSNSSGATNTTFVFRPANSGWTPLVGDWTNSGKDTVGLYSPADSLFYLKDSNENGMADMVIVYGAPNTGWKPIVGKWMGNAQAETAAQQVTAAPDTAALCRPRLRRSSMKPSLNGEMPA